MATVAVLPFVGRTYDRFGRSAVILPGLLCCAGGLAALAVVTDATLIPSACGRWRR